jgi:hypothetical protein
MWRALKEGNRDRIVGYNQYFFPPPTKLQDYIAGELSITDVTALHLLLDSNFRVKAPVQGWPALHATFSTTLEQGDWTFMRGGFVNSHTGTVQGADMDFSREYSFPPLLYTTDDLLAHSLQARDRNIWPIFNVLISQEGFMNPESVKQLEDIAVGLGSSRTGIVVPLAPSVVQLTPSLARTGPALNGPIYWPQHAQLLGWDFEGAFAAWLLDIRHCDRGVRLSCSSPCHSASLAGFSVFLVPFDSCKMLQFEDNTGHCSDFDNISGFDSSANCHSFGGWVCATSASHVILRDVEADCGVSGLTHVHANVTEPIRQLDSETHLVWLVLSRSFSNDDSLDYTFHVGQAACA